MTKTKQFFLYCGLALFFLLSIFLAYFFLSFKLTFKDIVTDASNSFNIEKSLIFSLIKAESKFDKNVKSQKGAVGLMQVKVSTANFVCFDVKFKNENLNILADYISARQLTENDLFDERINIFVGTKYFAYLLQKFENVDMAICAYNAGETNVKNWLNDLEFSKDGKTLSKIPFKETENYLKKVKFNLKIYKKIV